MADLLPVDVVDHNFLLYRQLFQVLFGVFLFSLQSPSDSFDYFADILSRVETLEFRVVLHINNDLLDLLI